MNNLNQADRTSALVLVAEMEKNIQALRRQIDNPRAWRHHVIESLQAVETNCMQLRHELVAKAKTP